jgi:lysophospholipase L1-like esterase
MRNPQIWNRTLPRVGLLLSALATMASAGCGNAQRTAAAAPTTQATPVQVGVDMHIPLRAWWKVVDVSRSGDEVYQARLSPANAAAGHQTRYVRMTGLGYPYVGSMGGHPYAGPEVDHQWDSQNNEYGVSFRFSGTRLGLIVLSTGGQWQARVNGAVVGGASPRSAGSSYAYHILDLDFSGAEPARSRTISFQLSGGAWLSGIGTDSASDQISPPPAPRSDTPSVYWLGDSYVAGAGARHPGFDDLVHVASRQSGLTNVTVDALGGTGYRRTNLVAKFPDYLTRAKKNLRAGRATPDLIIVGGSINDGIYSVEQVRAAASAVYRYLARAVPRAKVIVVPFTDNYPVPGPVQHAIEGVTEAARSAPNVIGVLDLPAQVLAQRGSGSVAGLDARVASKTVAYHPSAAAHRLYGEIIGRYIANVVRQRGLR